MSVYAEGLTWGEGPRWHAGALWASDPQGGVIWTDDGGEWRSTGLKSQSNGLWFLPDGRLVGAIIREKRIGRWDGTDFGPYADLSSLVAGPLGDMVGDAAGGLYVDDVGYAAHLGEEPKPGRIIYVDPDGRSRVAAEGIDFPNGLALIDGGRTLVVAETWVQRLTAFSVDVDGTLRDRRLFADLKSVVGPEARPDGICAGDNGVWVCTLTGHAVVLVGEDGLRASISTGDGFPVACCLDDSSRLLVTVAHSGGLPVMEAVANKTVTSQVEAFDVLTPQAEERA